MRGSGLGSGAHDHECTWKEARLTNQDQSFLCQAASMAGAYVVLPFCEPPMDAADIVKREPLPIMAGDQAPVKVKREPLTDDKLVPAIMDKDCSLFQAF